MNYNKEKICVLVLQLVIITLWVISTIMVFSPIMQKYFDVNYTSMWAFGAVFGIFYIPITRYVFERLTDAFNNNKDNGETNEHM